MHLRLLEFKGDFISMKRFLFLFSSCSLVPSLCSASVESLRHSCVSSLSGGEQGRDPIPGAHLDWVVWEVWVVLTSLPLTIFPPFLLCRRFFPPYHYRSLGVLKKYSCGEYIIFCYWFHSQLLALGQRMNGSRLHGLWSQNKACGCEQE